MEWVIAFVAMSCTIISVVTGFALGIYGVMLWSKNKPDDFDEALKKWRAIGGE